MINKKGVNTPQFIVFHKDRQIVLNSENMLKITCNQ